MWRTIRKRDENWDVLFRGKYRFRLIYKFVSSRNQSHRQIEIIGYRSITSNFCKQQLTIIIYISYLREVYRACSESNLAECMYFRTHRSRAIAEWDYRCHFRPLIVLIGYKANQIWIERCDSVQWMRIIILNYNRASIISSRSVRSGAERNIQSRSILAYVTDTHTERSASRIGCARLLVTARRGDTALVLVKVRVKY